MLISIHALREEGDQLFIATAELVSVISIHALREEGDALQEYYPPILIISIHALREEGDQRKVSLVAVLEEFLSTPSARRATDAPAENDGKGRFLSTPSARRATA